MHIGIYNPYIDSGSGGERYMLSLASYWSKHHKVEVFWDDEAQVRAVGEKLSINLDQVYVHENIFARRNKFQKLLATRLFDCIVCLSDGSVPMSLAQKNIIHFQVPFQHIAFSSLKLSRYQAVVCNSRFTLQHLDPRVSRRGIVIYPPVDLLNKSHYKKENLILTVGRIHEFKKQDWLIKVFRTLRRDNKFSTWRLIIAGGLLESDRKYFTYLCSLANEDSGVSIFTNCGAEELRNLYSKASLYWHAAGFGETEPEQMEHFGISTVESMSAGCVPLVFYGGGLPEIVQDSKEGYLWENEQELIIKTKKVIDNTQKRMEMSRVSMQRATLFSTNVFTQAFDRVLETI